MRGFLGGVSVGAIVAVLGAAGLSLMTPLAQRPEVSVQAPAEGGQPEASTASLPEAAGTDSDLAGAAPSVPAEAEQGAGDLSVLDPSVTDPGEKPKVGGATETLATPGTDGSAPQVATDGDTPVEEPPVTQAPDAPSAEESVAAPAEPVQPQVQQQAPDETGTLVEVVTEAPGLPVVQDQVPDIVTGADVVAPEAETAPQLETARAPAPAVQPAENTGESQTAETETSEPDTGADAEPEDRIATLPQAGVGTDDTRPRIGTPVVPLTERNLPAAIAEPEADEAPAAPALRPIEAYAEGFDNPDGKPLMSILLIDDGGSVGGEALLDFPYPLSFAVDPADPQASDKAARYRSAGFEVVVMADFPAAATPGDAETALEVWFGKLPETVALLEGVNGGIQGNRALSDQVTAVVDASGRGLITQDRGLNTVQKLAARDGVPSGVVFRDFDGAGQTPTVMRRFLDQAAFRAGQEGAVIMLGRVQPDTISALLLWGLQDRASRVALAPVSGSLLMER